MKLKRVEFIEKGKSVLFLGEYITKFQDKLTLKSKDAYVDKMLAILGTCPCQGSLRRCVLRFVTVPEIIVRKIGPPFRGEGRHINHQWRLAHDPLRGVGGIQELTHKWLGLQKTDPPGLSQISCHVWQKKLGQSEVTMTIGVLKLGLCPVVIHVDGGQKQLTLWGPPHNPSHQSEASLQGIMPNTLPWCQTSH